MMQVLTGIKGVTINEIIMYNKQIGRDVFVIDIYRTPIERKMSAFFENISSFHFNNTDSNVNKYDLPKVVKRFNQIFLHIA